MRKYLPSSSVLGNKRNKLGQSCAKLRINWASMLRLPLKEGFHQKIITSDKLQFCHQLQAFMFLIYVVNFSRHNLTHPRASTSTFLGPLLPHPGSTNITSGLIFLHTKSFLHFWTQFDTSRTSTFTSGPIFLHKKVFGLI
jgi:hypothetical protein